MDDREPADLNALIASTLATACRCDVDALHEETDLIDIGLDSLALVSVVAQIEARRNRELGEDELLAIFRTRTVGDIMALAHKMLEAEQGA
jgi:acyl carrier protein